MRSIEQFNDVQQLIEAGINDGAIARITGTHDAPSAIGDEGCIQRCRETLAVLTTSVNYQALPTLTS